MRFLKKNGYTKCVREQRNIFKASTIESLRETLWYEHHYDWVCLVNKIKILYTAHLLIKYLKKHECLNILEECTVYKNMYTTANDIHEKAISLVDRRGVYGCLDFLILKTSMNERHRRKLQIGWADFIKKKLNNKNFQL